MESVQNLTPGQEVVCPECGKLGVVAIDVFSAKGRKYQYLVVRHRENGKVRRCLIQRLDAQQAVAKPVRAKRVQRAKPARAAKQARPQAAAQAPAAPTIDVKAVVEEAVRTAVAEALKAVNAETARILAEAVSAAVREALAAVRTELEAQRAQLSKIEDAVRQRKGEGARAVQRGEVKIALRPGTLHWQIIEVLRGRELTKEQITAELERRFNRKVSGNSLSGRLSELRGAGYVECVRRGRTWLWRLAAGVQLPAASAEKPAKEEARREERKPAPQPARGQPAPAYVAPARSSAGADIPAGSSQAQVEAAGLPSFAVDNPWLRILAGREPSASSASTTDSASSTVSNSSGLPSFAVGNPWLSILSGNKAASETRAESGASALQSGLPSFAVDNPWLAVLARR